MHYLWTLLTVAVLIYGLDLISHALAVAIVIVAFFVCLGIAVWRRRRGPEDRYRDLTY